jgi:hypothetical protein
VDGAMSKGKVFNHTAHRELWDWLAKNPGKGKEDWPGWIGIDKDDIPPAYCYACQYKEEYGEDCPLQRNTKNCTYYGCLDNKHGLYQGAWHKKDTTERTHLAAQIRDLPVREGVKCI